MYINPEDIQTSHYDLVIIGSGGAGLMAAVKGSNKNLSVACISKVHPLRSHTTAAKGGINAALGNITQDHWHWHMYDTLRGSDWLADHDAVEYMCQNAPAMIYELANMGVPFLRTEKGTLNQRIYGGQSSHYGKGPAPHRACAAADRTGHAILHTLYQQALRNHVIFFSDHFAIDLLCINDRCYGALVWDIAKGKVKVIRAHHTILATGGFGQIYQTSTSSTICTGDGNALAARAGCPLQDMEFVQFHPTAFYPSGILVTEAARAEGAYLLNRAGERFMQRYAPHYRDLAPRDIIARAMSQELIEGRGYGPKQDHLHLSLTHLSKEILQQQLPVICETAKKFAGIDPAHTPIPVIPATHYTMGGIATNASCQALTVEGNPLTGLLAIGETACISVHGANRLGCNALLDLMVFSCKTVEYIANNHKKDTPHHQLPTEILIPSLTRIDTLLNTKSGVAPHLIIKKIKQTMQEYGNIIRSEERLITGINIIKELYQTTQKNIILNHHTLQWNEALIAALEAQNMTLQAYCTLTAAYHRTESRGSHFRSDHPQRDDLSWRKHSLCYLKNHTLKITYRPVRTQTLSHHHDILIPQPRQY